MHAPRVRGTSDWQCHFARSASTVAMFLTLMAGGCNRLESGVRCPKCAARRVQFFPPGFESSSLSEVSRPQRFLGHLF